eukprot:g57215.t1
MSEEQEHEQEQVGVVDPLASLPDENTFRILLTTDNHIGYLEDDDVRKEDTHVTFEEILQYAKEYRADFVLLGGDLFHDNKPSRSCMFRTMETLRKYTHGDDPVKFNVVSDQSVNFPTTGLANYFDSNVNVSLPIFAIHGNHDDPAGVGGYSAMDILHSSRLVNYFGKQATIDDIKNFPILMTKGTSKLALYGLGNIRDERLHRTFQSNKVSWVRPAGEDKSEWFNLCVLHQNRTKHSQHGKNFISESMLPPFLDMVVWGHEHECLIEPEESMSGRFFVTQPGSSVATSLSQGESVPKRVGMLEIKGENYRLLPIPLRTTRPFTIQTVVLRDHLDQEDPESQARVSEVLANHVNAMLEEIEKQERERGHVLEDNTAMLPLIRLRVDYTGFEKINTSRFGQQFVQKVANPEDLLQFFKQKKAREAGKEKEDRPKESDLNLLIRSDVDETPPIHDLVSSLLEVDDVDETPPIHDLVSSLLEESSTKLSVLSEAGLAEAIDEFVEKKNTRALESFLEDQLGQLWGDLERTKEITSVKDVEEVVGVRHSKQAAKERAERALKEQKKQNGDVKSTAPAAEKKQQQPPAERKAKNANGSSVASFFAPQPKSKPTAKKSGKAEKAEKKKSVLEELMDDDEEEDVYQEEEEEEEEEEEKPARGGGKRKERASTSTAAPRQSARGKKKVNYTDDNELNLDAEQSDVEDIEDFDEDVYEDTERNKKKIKVHSSVGGSGSGVMASYTQTQRSQGGKRATTSKRGRGKRNSVSPTFAFALSRFVPFISLSLQKERPLSILEDMCCTTYPMIRTLRAMT